VARLRMGFWQSRPWTCSRCPSSRMVAPIAKCGIGALSPNTWAMAPAASPGRRRCPRPSDQSRRNGTWVGPTSASYCRHHLGRGRGSRARRGRWCPLPPRRQARSVTPGSRCPVSATTMADLVRAIVLRPGDRARARQDGAGPRRAGGSGHAGVTRARPRHFHIVSADVTRT